MAHFAKIEDGVVSRVIVVNNVDLDSNNEETSGKDLIASLGFEGEWVQTSYNGNFRGVFAGVGYTWDGENFSPPEPSETDS